MGENLSKSDKYGIVDYGHDAPAKCIDCHNQFIRKEGVITIKGPSHPKPRCEKCDSLYTNEHTVFEEITKAFFGKGGCDRHISEGNVRKRWMRFTKYIEDAQTHPKDVSFTNQFSVSVCPECQTELQTLLPVEFFNYEPVPLKF